MKLSKRDISLLVILLGIIAFLVLYLVFYTPAKEENETLRSQVSSLNTQLTNLRAREEKIPELEAEIDAARENIRAISAGYPGAVRTENLIMFAVDLQEKTKVDTAGLNFSSPSKLAEMDIIYAADGTVEFDAKTAYRTTISMNTNLTYNYMKETVGYVYEENIKTTIDNISISYNAESGALYGVITVAKYFMTSPGDPYIPAEVPDMPVGVDNPFRSSAELGEPDIPADDDDDNVAEDDDLDN